MELKELKKQYETLRKKHKLPDFKELNKCFEIDKIERETDMISRDIRKIMMDKITGYKRFLEMILSPAIAPPLFLIFLKEMTTSDKDNIEKTYKALTDLELDSFELEIDYNEKKEIDLIEQIYKTWNNLKPNFREVIKLMRKNWNSSTNKKEKGYFG